MPGQSGNPRGRPKGLAKATRELVGEDGMKLAEFWLSIMEDPMRRDSDRLEASKLLADRGWGKAASFEPLDGDPLDLAALEGRTISAYSLVSHDTLPRVRARPTDGSAASAPVCVTEDTFPDCHSMRFVEGARQSRASDSSDFSEIPADGHELSGDRDQIKDWRTSVVKTFLVMETDEAAVVADQHDKRNVLSLALLKICNGENGPALARWLSPVRLMALRALGIRPLEVLESDCDFVGVHRQHSLRDWPLINHAVGLTRFG
jgi:hypothetical protein